MTLDELYTYITSQLTPEEALKKMLASALYTYEHLKLRDLPECQPEFIIAMAALDLGWGIALTKNEGQVTGLVVGTEDYMKNVYFGKVTSVPMPDEP